VLRRSVVAGVALTAALALPGAATAAPTITPDLAAGHGAGWVGREIEENGGYLAGPGGPDYNTTAFGVLALVAAGVGEEQAADATAYLMDHVEEYVVSGGADQPAALATLILVAHARGLDPSALVTRLLATKRTTGDDSGLFGAQDATYDGAYRQGLALLALAATGNTDADAIAWLTGEQCADGGWMGNRPEGAECPAFDWNTFVGEDTNGTALAAQALEALGVTPAHDPTEFFAKAQNADGGFAFVVGLGSDANSTGFVVQALLALGEDLGDWTAAKGTPYSYLLSLQVQNPPAANAGAFAFQGGATLVPNALATTQAVPALAGLSYPLGPRTLSNALPLLPAAAPPVKKPPVKKPPVRPAAPSATPTVAPTAAPTRAVNNAPVPELPATGGVGEKPWDATGLAVFALGLVGYGVAALGGARLAGRRAR
jgi:hypothetical protein